MTKEQAVLDMFIGEAKAHKKLPWKIGAMESGMVGIDSDDDQQVTGWMDLEDAEFILSQNQRISDLERQCKEQHSMELDILARDRDELLDTLENLLFWDNGNPEWVEARNLVVSLRAKK